MNNETPPQRDPSRRVIVTGATGFLGGWLIPSLLSRGYAVTTVLNPRNTVRATNLSQYFLRSLNERCDEVRVDLTDAQRVRELIERDRPLAVIHLAAIGDVTLCARNPTLAFNTSAITTLNLLEALRTSSPDTLFVSHTTDKVYSGNSVPFEESMPLVPTHIYEVAKVAQEHLTRCYAAQYGLNTVTIRCGNYFGGYDFNFNRVIPYAIRQCLDGKPIELRSNGQATRDFLYIEDAVELNHLFIDRYLDGRLTESGEAFNFSLEVSLSVVDLVRTIRRLTGANVDVRVIGTARDEIPHMRLSCDKAKSQLGWRPQTSLEEGLSRTIDAYKRHFSAGIVPAAAA